MKITSIFTALALALASVLSACSSNPKVPAATVSELAPGGTLRAAINLGNPILATRDPATGQARGVSVDLSRELAQRLGVKLELITFTSAGQVVEAVKEAKVDIAFVAIDPVRGADIGYSAAYVVIEGAYMVRNNSPIQRNEEVDRPGIRIAVGLGSAYDLFLKREIKAATLVRAPTSPAVTDLFMAQNLDVAAGVKQQLQMDAQRTPGLRLLDGRFMVINQAIGTPKARTASIAYLREFVEDMKASGFVGAALKRHGIEGAAVAELAPKK